MTRVSAVLVLIVLVFISIRTVSFGLWTWKKKNKLGAVMVFLIALVNLALPVYAVFFRD